MFTIDIMTLFPDTVGDVLSDSIIGRAQDRGYVRVNCHQIRDYTTNKQNQVDDYPYGGGRGAVMQAQPLADCRRHILASVPAGERVRTIYLSPCGKVFDQATAKRLQHDYDRLILVCGHYEGVDERFIEACVDEQLSLGDFVLTGGEIPAMAVADAVCRLVPGVLPEEKCYTEESHWDGTLEYPQYSRPETWEGRRVPAVLLGGNQAEIDAWRREQSLRRTRLCRPDMFDKLVPADDAEKKLFDAIARETQDDGREKTLRERIASLAELGVKTGVALQKGQKLIIACPVECAAFARLCAEKAFDAGAADVILRWNDDPITRQRYLRADEAVFSDYPRWTADMMNTLTEEGAAVLNIYAADPEMLNGVDVNRIRSFDIAAGKALAPYRERMTTNKARWSILSVPTAKWAEKVFPALKGPDAVAALWDAILDASRVFAHGDPARAWEEHSATLARRVEKLNGYDFRTLHYTNSLGTDLTVELPENHFWSGGRETAADGVGFCPNIPTEEIFTAPKRDGVNGVVYASKPLVLNGDIVEDFSFRFEAGRIVEINAKRGRKLLKSAVSLDEGASYLGEVALVPYASPISESGILFYNTLFDENASCHLAFGDSYPCIRGAEDLPEDERKKLGLNASITHEDFMVGTPDLAITGTTRDGREIPVFIDGNFAF